MYKEIVLKKRIDLVRSVLDDVARGSPESLIGLCDYLREKGYSMERVVRIGERLFGIPRLMAYRTVLAYSL